MRRLLRLARLAQSSNARRAPCVVRADGHEVEEPIDDEVVFQQGLDQMVLVIIRELFEMNFLVYVV